MAASISVVRTETKRCAPPSLLNDKSGLYDTNHCTGARDYLEEKKTCLREDKISKRRRGIMQFANGIVALSCLSKLSITLHLSRPTYQEGQKQANAPEQSMLAIKVPEHGVQSAKSPLAGLLEVRAPGVSVLQRFARCFVVDDQWS